MILSSHHVLFMDPRKKYLGRGRSCLKIPLERMKRYVNGIIECNLYNLDNITDSSLDTSPHCMATMAMIVQWMNIMGFGFFLL